MSIQVYEIFNPVDGKTEGLRASKAAALKTIARLEKYEIIRDYLPENREGFYVADMNDFVNGFHHDRVAAESMASYLNQGSDTNSFRVVHHSL